MSTVQQLDSFRRTLLELGPRQREVVAYLQTHRRASAWEMAANLKRYVHAVRPRITELAKLGLVRQAGEVWHGQTQRMEATWELVVPHEKGQMTFA